MKQETQSPIPEIALLLSPGVDMKQETQSPTPEMDCKDIGEEDIIISAYIEGFIVNSKSLEKLASRIQKDGLARMSIDDFSEPLYLLGRECFVDWINDLEGIYGWATPEYRTEYFYLQMRYDCSVRKLTRAIRNCLPNSQQAQRLAAAIDRLCGEVSGAIKRGASQYLNGKGKPQPADLLSDTRHGELWDKVENAIIALSTPQAETPLSNAEFCAAVRAEVRGLKSKSDAKEMKRQQRERAAQWLKNENAAGRKASIVDAARYFAKEIQAEKIKGGYEDVASLCTALNKCAVKLGIAQFKDPNRGRPRKD